MHAPSSFLSGFLRAARQTDWGSASPSTGGAPGREASGRRSRTPPPPRDQRHEPRHWGPVGAALPGTMPLLCPVPSRRQALAVGHRLARRRARRREGCPGGVYREPRLLLPGAAPDPPARVRARPVLPAQPRSSPGPKVGAAVPGPTPALSRKARPGSRHRRRSQRGLPAPGPVRSKRKRPRSLPALLPHQPGSPSRHGQGPDGADGAGRGPAGSCVGRTCGRCQVQGWGQSLPPAPDGSAGFPARGTEAGGGSGGWGAVSSQFRANTFV